MVRIKAASPRLISAMGCSLFFAYILSFVFEGQVLYSLLGSFGIETFMYLVIAMAAHLLGLLSCGFFVKSPGVVRHVMVASMGLCAAATAPFFFGPSPLWLVGLIVSGYASGCVVASFGYLLKLLAPKCERLKACADVLIYSSVAMIATNAVAVNISATFGLALSLAGVVLGMVLIWALPVQSMTEEREKADHKRNQDSGIKQPLLLLALFVLVITIDSGLMYQVINPAFGHLAGLASWYWAVPYIAALIAMRNLPSKIRRANALYVGMAMITAAFISFMILGRNALDYLIVDTLMLGACGIFDLFWWSILAEMLDFTDRPVRIFGLGLAANVLGVLAGDVLGRHLVSLQLSDAEVAVVALTIVSVTVAMLPILNRRLVMLLESHAYLMVFGSMSKPQQTAVIAQSPAHDPLTAREQEVLEVLLAGKSTREIAAELFISESTVKTHIRNIYSKYDVRSRAELISTVLKSQIEASS
ncbi:MAG: helix-turn-helix domain-containing protein [Limnochordia bacterium]|jgi:DNA-binding CsgD family transcriptional regulator